MQPVRNRYRPYAGGVASRLATDIYVAMVKPTILIVQMTQISNTKVISLMIFFFNFQTSAFNEFYGEVWYGHTWHDLGCCGVATFCHTKFGDF